MIKKVGHLHNHAIMQVTPKRTSATSSHHTITEYYRLIGATGKVK